MTYLLYINGLKNEDSVDVAGTPESTRSMIEGVAKVLHVRFLTPRFRTAAYPFPSMKEMGQKLAQAIKENHQPEQGPGVVVAQRSGAGILLEAFSQLDKNLPVPHVIAYKPLFALLPSQTTVADVVKQLSHSLEDRKIPSLTLITAETEPAEEIKALTRFKNAVTPLLGTECTLSIVGGTDPAHHTKRLADAVHTQLFAALG